MQLTLTKESSAQFLNFAEGFVTECYRRGLNEKQASAALEAAIPTFMITRNPNGIAGAEDLIKSAGGWGAAAKGLLNGSKTMAKGVARTARVIPTAEKLHLPSHMLTAAAGLTAATDNPISQAMPDWMRNTVSHAAVGGIAGRGLMGAGGHAAGAAIGGLAGAGRNFVHHYADLDAAGYTPDYIPPDAVAKGNRLDLSRTAMGDKLRRHQGELQNLESQMSTLRGKMQNRSLGLGGALERQLHQKEYNDLEARHREVTGLVSRSLGGLETDQAKMRAEGADRLATLNSAISSHRDKEVPLENLMEASNGRGLGSIAASAWASLTGADRRAHDIVARRRALEAAAAMERNRSTVDFGLNYH